MKVTLIAAVGKQAPYPIGQDGGLPWHCPDDLAFFRRETWASTVVVGRSTAETIPDLPGRNMRILSSRPQLPPQMNWRLCPVIPESLEQALNPHIFIAGGADTYKRALSRCDSMILSVIDHETTGKEDTFLPFDPYDPGECWRLDRREEKPGAGIVERLFWVRREVW